MKILIADDSTIIRERIKTLLSEIPRAVVVGEANTTQEVLEKSSELEPEIIILSFPISDDMGLETLKKLKSLVPTMSVFVLMNFPSPEYRAQCLEAGADFCFDKALEIDQIQETINHLIKF